MSDIPVLFIIFNRPDTTSKVFEAIRNVRPRYLYIASDAPRQSVKEDTEKCRQARSIIEKIDWDCELKTLFLEENLGTSLAPYTFIKWFFEQEEMGIVLEHDCLPDNDFFFFCREMLLRYKNDERIGIVSGSNFNSTQMTPYSYYFSKNAFIWGWASWKRTIHPYEVSLNNLPYKEFKLLLKENFDTLPERLFWKSVYRSLKQGQTQTWDYQLSFSLWRKEMLSIVPEKNLISNIGFGVEAINTTDASSPLADRKREKIFPLQHNPDVTRHRKAERHFFYNHIMERRPCKFYLKMLLKRIGIFQFLMSLKKSCATIRPVR